MTQLYEFKVKSKWDSEHQMTTLKKDVCTNAHKTDKYNALCYNQKLKKKGTNSQKGL